MKIRICQIFWKVIIRLLGCCRKEYSNWISMGGEVYEISICKFISPQEELKMWMDIVGDVLGGTKASGSKLE